MSELSITGRIKEFLPVESGISKKTQKEWQKQNFIVCNNDGYEGKEQIYCFEVFGGEKVENLTKFQKVGDEVNVQFNISTNEWKGKYFTSLGAWKIEKATSDQPLPPQNLQTAEDVIATNVDDLPF